MKNPLVSIIIPTLGRETLYPLISNLLKQKTSFEFEIVLIPQVKLKKELLNDKKIKIYSEKLGKGFAYYRNYGIKNSKGDILVFIDDDEMPMNLNWLENITNKLITKEEEVITAGVKIKLGQGYLTDCISLLGFPGGGAIGFKTMWKVDKKNYTEHLCSGNLAITKKMLEKIDGFSDELKNGNEDVDLGNKLSKNKVKIKYCEKVTVYHIARKGFKNFIKWNYLRGKSAGEYLSSNKKGDKITERLKSSLKILLKTTFKKPWYLLGVLFVMFNQYLWQIVGVLRRK